MSIPPISLSGQSQSGSQGRNTTSAGSRVVNIGGNGPGPIVYLGVAAVIALALYLRKG